MIIALDARPLMNRQVSGTEQHARNVVEQWAKMGVGHEFVLLCDKGQKDAALYDGTFVEGLVKGGGGRFKQVLVSGFDTPPRWFLGARMLHVLTRALRGSKAEVYHSFTSTVPWTTVCPVVQTVHDLAFELDPTVRVRPESRALRRLTRLGAGWAERIVAVSSQTKNDIESLYRVPGEKIAVVYNGINPVFVPTPQAGVREALRRRYGLGGTYVLAVGSDIPRRNYARMLEAMGMVWKADARIRLVLAGRTEWKGTALYKRAEAGGVLGRVVFVQAPTDEELAQLYRDATVTCCASSFEGFGMSVLESMACGTPVTCSDMRSLREVADDAALYFPHDDAGAMGESLVGLLEDVEYRRQLKYRGLGRARLFTWQTAAELILEVVVGAGSGTVTR